jgi:chromosome partitioning protein
VPVIALVGNKGGAGKTTLAMNLAAGLRRRSSTVLVDADPQGSAGHWSRVAAASGRSAVAVEAAAQDLSGQIAALSRDHPHVVVDCPPSIDAAASHRALTVCDFALVPVLPSPLDLWATTRIAAEVARAGGANPGLRAALVVNQLEPRTTLSRVVGQVLTELELDVLDAGIRRRAVYRNCMLEGRTVYDSGARGRDAIAEMEQLLMEIL